MVDSVLWAKSDRDQHHRRSGDNLLHANNALQMMATSGSRTRRTHSPDNGNVSLEDVDIIDLDGLNLDEEDGWLYRSTEPLKDSPNPYAWVRRDFDLNDVGSPRGFLLQTLEQATRKTASRSYSSRFCNTVLSPSGSSDALSTILDNSRPTNKNAVCKTLDYGCSTENGNASNTLSNNGVESLEAGCNTVNNDSVTSAKAMYNTVNNDSVTSAKTVCNTVNNSGVTSAKTVCNTVSNDGVTSAKAVCNDSVTSAKTVCNTVSNDGVTSAKTVCNDSVTSAKTLCNTVNNSGVTSAKTVCNTVNNDSVTSAKTMCNNASSDGVTSAEAVCNAVDNSVVANKDDLCDVPDSSQPAPKNKATGRYEIDTRTFTRPKKSAKNSNKIITDISIAADAAGDAGGCLSPESEPSPAVEDAASDEPFLKLEDVTDVQVMARMQEDSLRQSYSSPLSYTPKSQRRGLGGSTGRLTQGISSSSLSCHSDVTSPRLCHEDPLGITKSTNSLSSASSESSTSHSDSFMNVNPSQLPNTRGGFSETQQRSLPNLAKAAKLSVPRSVPSDSKLYTPPASKLLPVSAPGSAKSRGIPASKKSCSSPQPDASSVTSEDPAPVPARPKSGIPAAKPVSGIPKPSAMSRLRPPANWKKTLTTPTQNDGSWREGCF